MWYVAFLLCWCGIRSVHTCMSVHETQRPVLEVGYIELDGSNQITNRNAPVCLIDDSISSHCRHHEPRCQETHQALVQHVKGYVRLVQRHVNTYHRIQWAWSCATHAYQRCGKYYCHPSALCIANQMCRCSDQHRFEVQDPYNTGCHRQLDDYIKCTDHLVHNATDTNTSPETIATMRQWFKAEQSTADIARFMNDVHYLILNLTEQRGFQPIHDLDALMDTFDNHTALGPFLFYVYLCVIVVALLYIYLD